MSSTTNPSLIKRWFLNSRHYFAFPLVPEDNINGELSDWNVVSQHMELAKRGQFRKSPQLLTLLERDPSWVRGGMYARLIGAAAPDWVLGKVLLTAKALPDDFLFDYGEALFGWGRLDVVPALLAIFNEAYRYSEDAYYIPLKIGLLLEEELGELSAISTDATREEIDKYNYLVLQRSSELSQSLGEKAFVFRGRLLDVRWVAQCLIGDVNKPVPLNKKRHCEQMRGKFEGMTGIDCSPFYKDRRLQCLTTSAILEEFLESPEVTLFTPGIRYFFSHPVPSLSELEPKAEE